MSRPTSQASNLTAATRLGHARTQSVKTNTAPKLPPNPLPASDIRLFVTNLRLLDFDLRDDWPNITAQTFSAKNADQKQRISGTEWALFRLFDIWDPNETAQVRLDTHQTTPLLTKHVEAAPLFPTSRTASVPKPARRPVPMSQRTKEEWRPGS
jgi:hypothetical protein